MRVPSAGSLGAFRSRYRHAWPRSKASFHTSFYSLLPHTPRSTLFPYTTLFRSPMLPRPSPFPNRRRNRLSHRSRRRRLSRRSEEHTSELQSPDHVVCRLPLEKKNGMNTSLPTSHFSAAGSVPSVTGASRRIQPG